jgi:diguanylate cyclase (GGDEF)-like protein/PAS domain S-box-containing protein
LTSSNETVANHPELAPGGHAELIGVIAFLVIFAIGNYVLPFGKLQIHWWADLFWTTGSLLTALKCFAASRGLQGAGRNAWRLFGLGCFAWFLGMLAWDVQELLLGELTPFPSLSDVGYYLFGILCGLGFLYYRSERLHATLTLLEFSQFGIFLSCIILIHLVIFATAISQTTESSLYVISALAYPVLYMGVLIYCVATLWLGVRSSARYSLGFVVAGIAAHALSDSLYAYELLGRRYEAGDYLDIFWLIGFGLIYWGAALQQRRSGAENHTAQSPGPAKLSRLVPILSIGITIAIVIGFGGNLDHESAEQLTLPALLLLGFIALREWSGSALEAEQSQAVRNSEAQLRRIFSISPAMMSITRRSDGHFVDVNEAYAEISGYRRDELVGKSSAQLGLWSDARQRDQLIARLKTEGTVRGLDVDIRTKSGELRQVLASFTPVRIDDEEYLIGVALDLTDRHRADAEMRKLSRALEQTADTVMITDRAGILEYVNPSFEKITGYSAAEAIGRKPGMLRSGKQSADFYRVLWETILNGEVFSDVFINMNNAGNLYYEQKTITPLRDNQGMITHFIATGRDISERIEYEERLRFLAHHDAVTTLPNRALLLDHLKIAMAGARAHNRQIAVVFLDIDRFKNINDTLGHDAGDALLLELGNRLHNHLRGHDSIARFGGDEFVIVLNEVESPDDAATLAQRILENLIRPFSVADTLLHVSTSIGIALFPNDGEDSGTLLKNADAAMFRAKEMGGSNYQFYSADMGAHAQKRLTLENSLRLALERNEFVIHYQPLISADTGRIIGCEALLRWQHPEQGLVSPLDFIPLLEETGLIVVVGRWVIETACAQLAFWHRNGHKDMTMAINMASRQFHEAELVGFITDRLQHYQIEPRYLELEITESTLMQYIPATADTLGALSHLGVHIALDDFGTGYSSLSYLRRFPIDTLKIDRSFVRDIPGDQGDCEIVRAIIALAQSLHLRVVAEGVETAEQQQFLAELRCDVMQGYLFSKPVGSDEFNRLLSGSEFPRSV